MLAILTLLHLQAKPWNLFCGGDLMLNGVPASRKVFENLKVPADAIFYANLEIPLTNVRERTSRKTAAEIAARDQFILTAETGHIKNLKASGIDVVSLANNHAMDAGKSGLKQMLGLLDGAGIKHNGAGENWAKAVEPAILVAPDGTRVAFLSYLSFRSPFSLRKCTPATTTSPGISVLTLLGKNGPNELKMLQSVLKNAKSKADLVVVALHWGVERQPLPADYQVVLGRMFVDAGADVILGAHPHVLQPAELYKGKPIIYSLGNFANPGSGNTAMYKLTFLGKEFRTANIIPLSYQSGKISYSKRNPLEISKQEASLLKKYPSKDSRGLTYNVR